MRVAVLFSGGKDSTYATWLLQHQAWEIPALVTVKPRSAESFMFHYPAIEATKLQARALGIPQVTVEEGIDQDDLRPLSLTLDSLKSQYSIDGVATGAVASDYQKTRFENLCESVGLHSYSPLWHKAPEKIVDHLVQANLKIILTGVAAQGLDDSWLGRELDPAAWAELHQRSQQYGIHLTGEGGEYESLVLDAPNFSSYLKLSKTKKIWDGESGHLVVEEASLVKKGPD